MAGMIVTNNISALNTQRTLSNTNRMLSKSLEKLSSGYRINVAADDPSGLIISEQLRTQISGLTRATQNSQEAVNVIGIAEGALIEMNNILTKMRALAIHAANNGVTAPDQVRADQAEVDSGIQTIDRIANTTRYSDQFLLNGSKGLVYNTTTTVDTPMDFSLLDADNSRIDQVFKRSGSAITLNFTALNDPTTQTQAVWENQARRAYVEADYSLNIDTDVSKGALTADQSFVVTGSQGSRQFSFSNGINIGTVVQSINNVKDSLGVGATLTFQNSVTGVYIDGGTDGTFSLTGPGARESGDPCIYNLDSELNPHDSSYTKGVTGVTFSTVASGSAAPNKLVPGKNLDGEGRMYIRWINETEYVAYKDADQTMEVGRGATGTEMSSINNSDVDDAHIILDAPTTGTYAPATDDVTIIQFGQQLEMQSDNIYLNDGLQFNRNGMNLDQMQSIVDNVGMCVGQGTGPTSGGSSAFSGIRLGENTDPNGKLYFKTSYDTTAVPPTVDVNVYNNSEMDDDNLVASGTGSLPPTATPADPNIHVDIPIFSEKMEGGDGEHSGIYGTIAFRQMETYPSSNVDFSGSLAFEDIGMRLYTDDYGSQEYLRVQNVEGQLWGKFKNPESTDLNLIDEGQTIQEFGTDALISVNGQQIHTQGLVANVTTPNYSGKLAFNPGTIGQATIAQVGQDMGALMTRGGSLQAVSSTNSSTVDDPPGYPFNTSLGDPAYTTWVTNARHATAETLDQFIGGMQYQLGEGAGDQERTVYAIPGMAASNLGKVNIDGQDYSLQDVLAGGEASLLTDPVTAMKVVMQAVNDVSELRARLGAFQKNMLQTNINSLEVTIENITKTESAIRDANMASVSTEFTKNQILMQAGTSMLAQANQINQNVLQLLG